MNTETALQQDEKHQFASGQTVSSTVTTNIIYGTLDEISVNVKVVFDSKYIHIVIKIELTASVETLKRYIHKELDENQYDNLPHSQYFNMLAMEHPHTCDIFELSEEDYLTDLITNPLTDYIYIMNAADATSSPSCFKHIDTNTLKVELRTSDQEHKEEELKQLLMWHGYQGVKYTTVENARLAYSDQIHHRFFGSMIATLKHINLWKDDIIRNNVVNEMKEHGLTGRYLANTISFGLQLTRNQVLDLLAITRWLPSEIMPKEKNANTTKENSDCNKYRCQCEQPPVKRYNADLSLVLYFCKTFDGAVRKRNFPSEIRQKYLGTFGKFIGLQQSEIEYLQKLYQTEKDLSALFRVYL